MIKPTGWATFLFCFILFLTSRTNLTKECMATKEERRSFIMKSIIFFCIEAKPWESRRVDPFTWVELSFYWLKRQGDGKCYMVYVYYWSTPSPYVSLSRWWRLLVGNNSGDAPHCGRESGHTMNVRKQILPQSFV